MLSLVQVSLAVLERPSGTCNLSLCQLCDRRDFVTCRQARPLYDEPSRGLDSPMCGLRVSCRPPTIPVCNSCYEDCRAIYEAAKRRIAAVGWQRAAVVDFLFPRDVSTQLVAQRMSLLRALTDTIIYPARNEVRGPWTCRQVDCVWCGVSTSDSDWGIRWKGAMDVVRAGIPRTYRLHRACLDVVNETILEEHLALCMATCALRLPLLPEVGRQVALFIVQLTAIGVEAAAAGRCPVYTLTAR